MQVSACILKAVCPVLAMLAKKKGRPSRCRLPKSASDEHVLADEAVPLSTKYKSKWAFKIFRDWQ